MPRRPPMRRLLVAGFSLGLLAGCTHRPAPVLSPVAIPRPRPIVVYVPGFTGTVLRDSTTGKVIWGDGPAAMRPHDGGLRTALALDPARDPRPAAEPAGPVLEIHEFGVHKEAYRTLLRTMEANGWTVGEGARPPPDTDFLFFTYDWRRDAVAGAASLAHRLEALRDARGGGTLRVTLIGQSHGAEVVRWLLKYGAAALEEAEAGIRRPPSGVVVDRAIFLGSSSGGSLRSLRYFDEGRRYVPVVGRRFVPEVIFTYASLYEDLPVYRRDLFVDDEGRPLDIDVLDPGTWKRLGWSIYGPAARRRLEKLGDDPILGDDRAREAYLAGRLSEARRFHRLLDATVDGFAPVRLYAIEGRGFPTLARAVVPKDGGLRFPAGGVDGAHEVDGDGHAPQESCTAFSRQELAMFAKPPFFARAKHFDLILDADALRELLAILAAP